MALIKHSAMCTELIDASLSTLFQVEASLLLHDRYQFTANWFSNNNDSKNIRLMFAWLSNWNSLMAQNEKINIEMPHHYLPPKYENQHDNHEAEATQHGCCDDCKVVIIYEALPLRRLDVLAIWV